MEGWGNEEFHRLYNGSMFEPTNFQYFDLEENKLSQALGREPWASGYGRRLVQEVVGSNTGAVYWMDVKKLNHYHKPTVTA